MNVSSVKLRLSDRNPDRDGASLTADFEAVFHTRQQEAEEFYAKIMQACALSDDQRHVQRQAFAGMLWTKQFYYFVLEDWLKGDPAGPPPPTERRSIRNQEWLHLFNRPLAD